MLPVSAHRHRKSTRSSQLLRQFAGQWERHSFPSKGTSDQSPLPHDTQQLLDLMHVLARVCRASGERICRDDFDHLERHDYGKSSPCNTQHTCSTTSYRLNDSTPEHEIHTQFPSEVVSPALAWPEIYGAPRLDDVSNERWVLHIFADEFGAASQLSRPAVDFIITFALVYFTLSSRSICRFGLARAVVQARVGELSYCCCVAYVWVFNPGGYIFSCSLRVFVFFSRDHLCQLSSIYVEHCQVLVKQPSGRQRACVGSC